MVVSSESGSLRNSGRTQYDPALPHDVFIELRQLDDEAIGVVRIKGALDRFSSPRLKDVLRRAVESGTNQLIIDLSELTSVDSSGLGILIVTLQRARRAGGGLRLASANQRLVAILRTMSLDQLFQRDDTVQDAINFFRSSGQANR